MPIIHWSNKLATGVPEIDDQHAQLVSILNDFHAAVSLGRGERAARHVLCRLNGYAIDHFAFEEQHMQRLGYPGYATHKQAHDATLARLVALQDGPLGCDLLLAVNLLRFLNEWLVAHIGQSDRKLAAFMLASGKVVGPQPAFCTRGLKSTAEP